MPIVLKSGSLNLLEPSGPVQASNRFALPLPLPLPLPLNIRLYTIYGTYFNIICNNYELNYSDFNTASCKENVYVFNWKLLNSELRRNLFVTSIILAEFLCAFCGSALMAV